MKHRAQQNGRLGSSKLLFDHRKKHKKNNFKKRLSESTSLELWKTIKSLQQAREHSIKTKQNKKPSSNGRYVSWHFTCFVSPHNSSCLGLGSDWWLAPFLFIQPEREQSTLFCILLFASVLTCQEYTWRMDRLISSSRNSNAGG